VSIPTWLLGVVATMLVTAVLLVTGVLVDSNPSLPLPDVSLPRVASDVEPVCIETMRRSPLDLSWVAPRFQEQIGDGGIQTVSLGELSAHTQRPVRVAGFLHMEFESIALYPSRTALKEHWLSPRAVNRFPWVDFHSLWPHEAYWRTKAPAVSNRCVAVEGTYSRDPAEHFGRYSGAIRVLRLDVWSWPHRPYITTPPPPPPWKR
jgi:hypothetical protein